MERKTINADCGGGSQTAASALVLRVIRDPASAADAVESSAKNFTTEDTGGRRSRGKPRSALGVGWMGGDASLFTDTDNVSVDISSLPLHDLVRTTSFGVGWA